MTLTCSEGLSVSLCIGIHFQRDQGSLDSYVQAKLRKRFETSYKMRVEHYQSYFVWLTGTN